MIYEFCLFSESDLTLISEINSILKINNIDNVLVTDYSPDLFSNVLRKGKIYNIEIINSDKNYIEITVPNKQTYLIMEGNVVNKISTFLNIENRGVISTDYNTSIKHPRISGTWLPYIDGSFYTRKLSTKNIELTTINIVTNNIFDKNKVAYIIAEEIARNVGRFITKNINIKKEKFITNSVNIVKPKTLEIDSLIRVNNLRGEFKVEDIKLVDGKPHVLVNNDKWLSINDIHLL